MICHYEPAAAGEESVLALTAYVFLCAHIWLREREQIPHFVRDDKLFVMTKLKYSCKQTEALQCVRENCAVATRLKNFFPLAPSTPRAAAASVLGCHVGRPKGA